MKEESLILCEIEYRQRELALQTAEAFFPGREIRVLNDLAGQGVAIIMVSSELPEVLGMSDRVMVVHEGHIGGFIDKEKANQENIMTLATGGQIDG